MEIQEQKLALMNATINQVEERILSLSSGQIRKFGEESPDFPTFHHFTPGLYCRELHMPAGSVVTSYVHRMTAPYVVSKGECWVFSDECQWVQIVAPHFGITKKGTRRMLAMVSDTIWTTFHVTELTDIEELERFIFEVPLNPLFDGVVS